MSYIKNNNQISHIKVSCRMAAEIMEEMIAKAQIGVTTREIDQLAAKLARKKGVVPSFKGYQDYPANVCISVNNQIVHGLPGPYALKKGDVLGIDFGINYRGYFSDMARTIPIGEVSKEATILIDTTRRSLDAGIAQVKPGNEISDIGRAIETEAKKNKFGVVRELVGHGVGMAVHEPPAIPNYPKAGPGVKIVPGMVLAIEPMFNLGGDDISQLDDGWTYVTKDGSISAHFEDTILVTELGHQVLTRL